MIGSATRKMIGSTTLILLILIVQYIQGRTLFDATFNDEMSSIIEKYEHKRDEATMKIATLKSIKKEISDVPSFIEEFGDVTEREINTVEDKSQLEDISSLISKFLGNRPSKSNSYHKKRNIYNGNLKNINHSSRRSMEHRGKKEIFSQKRDEDLYRDILKTILDDSSKLSAYHEKKKTTEGDEKEDNESLLDMMTSLLNDPSRSSAYHGKKEIVEKQGHDNGKDKTEKKKELNDKTEKETSEEEDNEKKSFLAMRKKNKKKKLTTEPTTQPPTREMFERSSTQKKKIKSTPSRSTAYHGKKDDEQKGNKKKSEKENANLDNVLKRLTNMLDKRISAEASDIRNE